MSVAKQRKDITVKDTVYDGFSNLPNQIYRYCVLRGFDFNLMVVGESGLGKSTFINSLFATEMYTPQQYSEKVPPILKQTMSIQTSNLSIVENGVSLNLTLIDTPGFGDGIDNTTCWGSIASYIDSRYADYMKWEGSPNRTKVRDMRVHACLYFISPTGHRLKPLDVEFLKRLNDKVTIIPVIGKADTLCKDDLLQFKTRILDDLKVNGIRIYDFPQAYPQDEDDRDSLKSLLNRIPFAVVSSNKIIENGGKKSRIRKYPWGVCEVENLDHCDFIALRDLLLKTSICHLIDITHTVLYEKYRSHKLGDSGETSDSGLLDSLEQEKLNQQKRLEEARNLFSTSLASKTAELSKELSLYEDDLKKKNSANESLGKLDTDQTSLSADHKDDTGKHDEPKEKKKSSKKKLF